MKLSDIVLEKWTPEEKEKRKKAGLEAARVRRDMSTKSKGSRLTGMGRGSAQADQSMVQK